MSAATETSRKPTEAEMDIRISEVIELMLDGATRYQIVRHAAKKWNVKSRMVDEYISRAKEQIREINQASAAENMALITRNLWSVYRAAKAKEDIGEANRVLMNLAKLKGLDQSTITHVIEDRRDLEELADEDLDRLLEQEAMQ